jgi:carbon-monoxide dehydrogenase medium subunit
MPITYLQPVTVAETLELLAQHRDQSRLINGGTDLLIEIERKLRTPQVVIDVSRVAGLAEIHVEGDTVRLGAGVTHNQVVAHALLRDRAYALARACWEVGAPQIRNRGTLAGNLVTASPANDTITPLWALGATVTLKSLRGERTLSFPEFFKGVRNTALAPDEMLTEISLRLAPPGARSTFLKLGLRRAQAISVVNVAVLIEYEKDLASTVETSGTLPTIRRALITLGSVAPTIVAADETERWLTGQRLADDVIAQAGYLAIQAAMPIDDVRGTAEYRREMVRVYVMRALRQLRDGTERADFPAQPVMLWGQTPAIRHDTGSATLSTGSNPTSPLTAATASIATTVNGKHFSLNSAHDKTLLRFLREDLRLTGTKEGCAEGECGACTVFLDGAAVMSCLVPASRAHGAQIVTIEGLGANGALHPVQRAFVDTGAVQCGYCTPGFVMSGAKLLEEIPSPSRSDIQQAFTGNLCRCTGYVKIVQAMLEAIP